MRLFEKCMALLAVLLIFFVVGCGGDDDEQSEQGSDFESFETGGPPRIGEWDNLTQLEKNRKILTRAIDDLEFNIKLSCKVWIQHVVRDATDGYMLPLNDEVNGDRWIKDEHNRVFGLGAGFNSSTDIRRADPGAIVQIQWKKGRFSNEHKYNRHTAIVLYVSDKHIIFIESNYDDTPADVDDAYVRVRATTANEFYSDVESFTVYYVR